MFTVAAFEAIIPDSVIELYADVPISGGHQLIFSSKNKQAQYFANKKLFTRNDCTYQRKNRAIRIQIKMSLARKCDYLSFINPSFENIKYYARIVDTQYVNNETTDIIFEIDSWQTFMFDAEYKACSILREHLTEADYVKAKENPWRRDIPELLTDEGLPCGESLEKIYTNGELQATTPTGDRFKIPQTTTFTDPNGNDMYIVFQISHFDAKAASENVKDFETVFYDNWDFYGGFTSKPNNISEFFTSYNSKFIRPTAFLGIYIDAATGNYRKKINRILNLMTMAGITGQIQGIYVLPKWSLKGYWSNGDVDRTEGFTEEITIPKNDNINPKLNTFPFSFMRVKSASNTKEYRYDLFNSLARGDSIIKIEVKCNSNGAPVWSFAPWGYKNDGDKANYYERIDFNEFPQAAFSTDAYLSFLSAQYTQQLQQGTLGGTMSTYGGVLTSAARDVANIAGLGMVTGQSQTSTRVPVTQMNQWGYGDTTYQTRTTNNPGHYTLNTSALPGYSPSGVGGAIDNINLMSEAERKWDGSSAVFDSTKRAYVNDNYHPGSSGGYLPYSFDSLNFIVELVTLNDDVLDKYNDYLNVYGYKSLRTGIPHVCDFVKNGKNAPHFSTFDGDKITYVQTENMHVEGLQNEDTIFIENMFNSGVRFLKGDMS